MNNDQHMNPLSRDEWALLYANNDTYKTVLHNLQSKDYSVWTQELLNICQKGWRVCELGVGTGETTLALAQMGCDVTCIDYSDDVLSFVGKIAKRLDLSITTVHCDVLDSSQAGKNQFDVVFSCGLLEHFNFDDSVRVLNNYRDKCTKMISMVPNAASIAYAHGKSLQERAGTWRWGKENPSYTQSYEFICAGYEVEKEYTIGEKHALNFLDMNSGLRKELEKLWDSNTVSNYHQGYLLVTIGGAQKQ